MTNTVQKSGKNPKAFFSSIDQLKSDLRIISGRDDYLAGTTSSASKHRRRQSWFRLILQGVVTVVVVIGGGIAVFSSWVDEDSKKWVTGVMGTVVGYWIR